MKTTFSMAMGVFIFCSLFTLKARSYIPKLNTILVRTTENHGYGLYLITQDVFLKPYYEKKILHTEKEKSYASFLSSFVNIVSEKKRSSNFSLRKDFNSSVSSDFVVLREKWWIKNDQVMKLEVKQKGSEKNETKAVFIYNGQTKYWISLLKKLEKTEGNHGSLETFFHLRNSEKMLEKIKKEKILFPEDIQAELKRSGKIGTKTSSFSEETSIPSFLPYMRLMRSGGVMTYGIGKLSSPSSLLPGIWIEQDKFLIKKIRLSLKKENQNMNNNFKESETIEILAEKHRLYKRNFWFPEMRKIKWKGREIFIKLIQIQSLKSSKKNLAHFNHQSLKDKLNHSPEVKWDEHKPSLKWIKEFYYQLR